MNPLIKLLIFLIVKFFQVKTRAKIVDEIR